MQQRLLFVVVVKIVIVDCKIYFQEYTYKLSNTNNNKHHETTNRDNGKNDA
jgi:mannose/fructose/N-acetylgalactosamine-specific phosphotransferase system component IID